MNPVNGGRLTARFPDMIRLISDQPWLGQRREDAMTMTDVALWIIFAAMIAIVPCGCYFTRPRKKEPPIVKN
jgi:hypothetical protein